MIYYANTCKKIIKIKEYIINEPTIALVEGKLLNTTYSILIFDDVHLGPWLLGKG